MNRLMNAFSLGCTLAFIAACSGEDLTIGIRGSLKSSDDPGTQIPWGGVGGSMGQAGAGPETAVGGSAGYSGDNPPPRTVHAGGALQNAAGGSFGVAGRAPTEAAGGSFGVAGRPPAEAAGGSFGVAGRPPAEAAGGSLGVAGRAPAEAAGGSLGIAGRAPAEAAGGSFGVAGRPPAEAAGGSQGTAGRPPTEAAGGSLGVAGRAPAEAAGGSQGTAGTPQPGSGDSIPLVGGLYTQGDYSGYLWTSHDDAGSAINPPCGADVCFADQACVSGVLGESPNEVEPYNNWGVLIGWTLAQQGVVASLSGKTEAVVAMQGSVNVSARLVLTARGANGESEAQYCAPIYLYQGVNHVPLSSLTQQCWTAGGTVFDPLTMAAETLAIQLVPSTSMSRDFDACVTTLAIQ